MKNTLLFLFAFYLSSIYGQMTDGLTKISGTQRQPAFMLEDKSGALWIGLGGAGYFGTRYADGLKRYKNNQMETVMMDGVFTDAIERGNEVLITSFGGLYTYRHDSVSVNAAVKLGTSIAIYHKQAWIGTYGNGLFYETDSGYQQLSVIADSTDITSYDSILSLCAEEKNLWIGTTNGLIRYDGKMFHKVEVPAVAGVGSFAAALQKQVRDLEIDGYGRLWMMSNYYNDTVSSIYLLDKGAFISARDFYKAGCTDFMTIPLRSLHFGRTKWGHILLTTSWGAIELTDSNRHYVTEDLTQTYAITAISSSSTTSGITYESPSGIIYINNPSGLLRLDPSIYSLKGYRKSNRKAGEKSTENIDINDLLGTMGNTGSMFDSYDVYNVFEKNPMLKSRAAGCAKMMYSAGLWMGGINRGSGDLHVAAQTYRQRGTDFYPGPIRTTTLTYDSVFAMAYDRLWKVDRKTIDDFRARRMQPGYVIPQSIIEWPGNSPAGCDPRMAPYVDVDNNKIYEPSKGDYPDIKGDQMIWWVFNDFGMHGETKGTQMRVQVNASCYAYNDVRLKPEDPDYLVNRSIFFDLDVINLGTGDYDDFYLGVWNDVDLGNYSDDYVGYDSAENAGFGFNGDNQDISPYYGFGENPPIICCKFLNRPMSSFTTYNNDFNPVNGNPEKPGDFYKYLSSGNYNKGLDKYPCDADVNGTVKPGDKRFLMSAHADNLAPGETFRLSYAYIMIYNPETNWLDDDCDGPRKSIRKIQAWYDGDSFPSKPYLGTGMNENIVTGKQPSLYPNPAGTQVHIALPEAFLSGEADIYDQAGRLVKNYHLSEEAGHDHLLDISVLSPGMYIFRISAEGQVWHHTLIRHD
jgi:hypothetical protein